ncbi:hypothetical protein Fcan01_11278 [Folsomia candida]|uniref:Uncharacterized protein n=1 Tax=Folsomia candida TaxID=158441 RepID=A0A226EA73_FOLCA|nr:hypothetical protein Fcan01_11278 [Folsomia candida]
MEDVFLKHNYINRKVISKSTHCLQITSDVALSKKPPSPKVTLDGGNDITNRFINFESFRPANACSNSTDWTNGFAIILNGPTITTNNSTPTAAKSIKIEYETTVDDVIRVYNAKLSHAVTLPTNMDMMGCLNTELCRSVRICKTL